MLRPDPHHLYPSCLRPCKGGWIHAHSNPRHPDLLSFLMDEPRLAAPELLEAPNGHADEIDQLMAPWLRQHEKFDVVQRAQEVRLPFTEVLLPSELLKDEHLRERGFFVPVEQSGFGEVIQLGASVKIPDAPWRVERAPLLGEHTQDILSQLDEDRDAASPTTRPRRGAAVASRPLAGVRIVEFTTAVAAPSGAPF